ncbi:MAG TPA: GTP cyclohydrolase I, partial [Pseudomonadales bacterium]|nr:GTP cyclohydrolase I [Pseudomonadales bacterium]
MESIQTTRLIENSPISLPVDKRHPAPDSANMEPLVREMLLYMGEDPEREGLKRTPLRVAKMYQELLA